MPVETTQPLPELMEAIREYHAVSGRRVTLAWTMISGFNVREEDAVQLAELVRGLPITLESEPDAGWMTRSQVEALALRAASPGGVYTLTLRNQTLSVMFRHHDAPAFDASVFEMIKGFVKIIECNLVSEDTRCRLRFTISLACLWWQGYRRYIA